MNSKIRKEKKKSEDEEIYQMSKSDGATKFKKHQRPYIKTAKDLVARCVHQCVCACAVSSRKRHREREKCYKCRDVFSVLFCDFSDQRSDNMRKASLTIEKQLSVKAHVDKGISKEIIIYILSIKMTCQYYFKLN